MIEGETVAGEDIDGIFERIEPGRSPTRKKRPCCCLPWRSGAKVCTNFRTDELAALEQADRKSSAASSRRMRK
jgi:hypothetical protein